MTVWPVIAVLLFVVGCASQPTTKSAEKAIQATREIPPDELLDVGIELLDPGLPAPGEPMPDDVFPELRQAESRYIAIQLKNTMEGTGQWGAVRVLPPGHGFTDLKVTGKILVSTGMKLAIDLRVVDAGGREWLAERYRAQANPLAYSEQEGAASDPFQSLYNEISNDILKARQRRSAAELRAIRQITRMRFAADIAPEPFTDYLATDRKGRISTRRLPARDDPMVRRIDTIRASENLFVDTLDQHYTAFFEQMSQPYDSWRQYTYEEEKALREFKRKAMTQKILGGLAILGAVLADVDSPAAAVVRDAAVIGGIAAIHSGIATSKEAKIHAEALRELGASVADELEPIVIEVEGTTLRLSGSAAAQYDEWRRLLREIWNTETGLPTDLNQPAASGGDGNPAGPGPGSSS
jgi:hypothetical protein